MNQNIDRLGKSLNKEIFNILDNEKAGKSLNLSGVAEALRNLIDAHRAEAYADGYQGGGEYVLGYMSDLYEGVEETDVWADFHEEQAN